MAYEHAQRPSYAKFGSAVRIQQIDAAAGSTSALQTTEILNYGATVITSTGTGDGHTWTLGEPRKGIEKTLIVHGPGGSTLPAFVQTNSSAVTIGETTGNQLTFSTAAALSGSAVNLIGLSSVAWVLANALPTGVTIAAATKL